MARESLHWSIRWTPDELKRLKELEKHLMQPRPVIVRMALNEFYKKMKEDLYK